MEMKPKIVIIGAGMSGLTAANELYRKGASKGLFELCVVEGGNRIGGRINSSELGGDRIELGATWIHGIIGSPIHKIAQESHSLESQQPWECMEGLPRDPVTIAENGYKIDSSITDSVSTLFNDLLEFAQGKATNDEIGHIKDAMSTENLSLGSFLRKGLDAYWDSAKDQEEVKGYGSWNRKNLEEAIFAMLENRHKVYTAANDLSRLDYKCESELGLFPGEHISIAKGYSSVIKSLASGLPAGLIQLGKRVSRIEWQPEHQEMENGVRAMPVKLYFDDGTTMTADHVIVTVSLGVLKAGILESSGMFKPALPKTKTDAISRFGFGVVDKVFLQLGETNTEESSEFNQFPLVQFVFHPSDSESRQPEIPSWMRNTPYMYPIHSKSRVLVTWFVGEDALQVEAMKDDEIIDGVSTTISSFLSNGGKLRFEKVLKGQWGSNPLFLGSYSYVAVGSSADDMDIMAEPLPETSAAPPLQILFAGEATHRNHFSTTHGAYLTGIREANRVLQHYHIDV